MMHKRPCAVCAKEYETNRPTIRRVCSIECRVEIDSTPVNDCWIWQGSHNKINGYAQLTWDSVSATAIKHLAKSAGFQLSNDVIADVSCGNRLCVNPRHIMTRAPRETLPPYHLFKLTADEAKAIYTSTEIRRVLAERYNCTPSTISKIRSGKIWRSTTGHKPQ